MRRLRIALQNPPSIVPMASARSARLLIRMQRFECKPGAGLGATVSWIDSNPLHNSVYHTAWTRVVRIESCP